MRHLLHLLLISALIAPAAVSAAKPDAKPGPGFACTGAIAIDATTGRVLVEEHADARGEPASVTKLMTFLVVMNRVEFGGLKLDTPVTVSAEASRIGGSQVYLKEKEVFTVDELLYALMVQSANDAAYALAEAVAGSRDAFVALMNEEAKKLGMAHTVFCSPHGLPPDRRKGQQADVTTARDLSVLCRELVKRGDILRYTAVKQRSFRSDAAKPVVMTNHNKLLWNFAGCDGLKTGYSRAAGASLAATAYRDGNRVIAIVLGCTDPKESPRAVQRARDRKAMELLQAGLAALPPVPAGGNSGAVPPPVLKDQSNASEGADEDAEAAGQEAAPPMVEYRRAPRPQTAKPASK